MRIADVQPETEAQHEGEDGGDEAAEGGALVVRPGAALGADHDDGAIPGCDLGNRGVEEVEIDVVDVEVDDDVAPGGQQAGPQRPAVVRLGRGERRHLRHLCGQLPGDRGGSVAAAVLHDHDLEGSSAVAQAVGDRVDRLVEEVLLIVGWHHDRELQRRHRGAILSH